VVIAGTHRVNVTYDGFHIIERDVEFYPDAMRISGFQAHMSSRLNEPRLEFTQKEIETSYQGILKNIEDEKVVQKPKDIKGVSYN
jgi:hypothetical protein